LKTIKKREKGVKQNLQNDFKSSVYVSVLKMVNKERVNWTIDPYCIKILRQAKKLNTNPQISISKLVEYAIRNTFKNKEEYYKEQMKHHQQMLMEFKGKLEDLEESRG